LRSETGEERGFLECRVATADDGDVLVAEEESITGGAPAHTVTGQLLLIGQTELAIGRTGRQDHFLGRVKGTKGSYDLMGSGVVLHIGGVHEFAACGHGTGDDDR